MLIAALALLVPLQDQAELEPRTPLPKMPVRAVPLPPDAVTIPDEPAYRLIVKFVDAARVRAASGKDGEESEIVHGAAGVDLAPVRELARAFGVAFAPLIRTSEHELDALLARAAARSGRAQPDLGGFLRVDAPALSAQELERLATALQELDAVEIAYIQALGAPPPGDIEPPTPDHVPLQTYRGPDPGIDADYAWTQLATGAGVRLSDCEYGWTTTHEDLIDVDTHPEPGQTVPAWVFMVGWDNHGAAVLGETSAPDNGYGVSGMIPAAEIHTYPEVSDEEGSRRVTCIANAIAASAVGDVVLLEMQTTAPGVSGYGPAELDPAVWSVTKVGTDAGVVVVGAAGNGGVNLDSPAYAAYQAMGDSGAIIVGAGTSTSTHDKLDFSTYGSRVDVQGWGENVLSLGYGDAFEYGGDSDQQYTYFSGTSSASPFVASAAVALQSLALAYLGGPLAPAELRDLLIQTGVPQGSGGEIGPMVNLRAAINALGIGFQDLGLGLGGFGTPKLVGEGVLAGGTPYELHAHGAAPSAPALLIGGPSRVDLPLLGGTLVPSPKFAVAVTTTASGEFHLASTVGAVPPGTKVYLQLWIADASGPLGATATNGLEAMFH